MTYPLTDAQLAVAMDLAARKGYATQLTNYLNEARRGWINPQVVAPEQVGAPESTGNTALDMIGLNACKDLWASAGLSIELRRGYNQNAQLELVSQREGEKDGQHIFGYNRYKCGLTMVADGFDSIRFRATVSSGGALPMHVSAHDMYIKGGSGTGKGFTSHNNLSGLDTRISGGRFHDLLIFCGSDAFEFSDTFTTSYKRNHVSSHNGHGFALEGGNTTLLEGNYAGTVGRGKAGYRIVYFATMIANNGLNVAQGHYAIFGGRALTAALTTRAGGTASRVFLNAADPGADHEYDGLQLVIAGVDHLVENHVIFGHADAPYVDLVTPRGAPVATGTSYQFRDGESGKRNGGVALDRRFRGTVTGSNVEAWGNVGIKYLNQARGSLVDVHFFDAANPFDTCIYFHQGNQADGYEVAVRHCTLTSATGPRFGHNICQAQGGATPAWWGEGLDSGHRSYRDMRTASTVRDATHWGATPASMQIAGTMPSTDPGDGKLWASTPA
jgi:hypothetical protein